MHCDLSLLKPMTIRGSVRVGTRLVGQIASGVYGLVPVFKKKYLPAGFCPTKAKSGVTNYGVFLSAEGVDHHPAESEFRRHLRSASSHERSVRRTVPDSQPAATELLQSPLYGPGTVFRSISHLLRHFLSSALV